jgi:hypothetical protein
MEIHNKVTALPTFFLLLLISFFSLNANAVSPPSASGNQSGGNYTITYNHNTNYPVLATWLEEKVDGGAWTTITDSAPLGTINFTDKVNGTYQYRVVQLEDSYYSYPLPFTISWSSAITVVVTGGAPSDMAYSTQLTYNYEARKGDINADGLQDLYIKRTSGGSSNNGVLYETILTQLADKTFSVLSASASQKAIASGWPTINVDIRSADFNIDGYIDLVVKDIGNHISGAASQMIFSSANPSNGQASAATSLGSYINKTMTNIAGNFSNPDYFDQYMVQVQVPYPILVCGFYYDYFYERFVYGCWYEYVIVTVPGYDPNFVSQEGLNFAFTWTELEQASTDGDFRTKAEILYDIFGTILGIDMGVDRPDFNNQNAVEEALAKIWVILSDLCGESGVTECIGEGAQTAGEEATQGLISFHLCAGQLLTGQAPLPFTGNPYRTPKVSHSGSQNFSITSSQSTYSAGTTDNARRNFWMSRYNDSKDPLGPLGVNVVDNAYILGCLANERTIQMADIYGQTVSLNVIGVDMMRAHRDAVTQDGVGILGKLSAKQIAEYHVEVFGTHGLPARTFGGAPFTGIPSEAERTKVIWCPSCE